MTRLRAVDLHGYKSFATRTSLQFDAPVTAIVGPNGSGKSNVMDALRWAIGAGSGRALRTRRAEDVVFSGGRERAPSGFAEVRVELDNSDRWIDLDAAEVEIHRRVHRDGQSEIRVNGRVARLRDVQDLFRDSGLGSGGFALMSQGLVDEMLRLRPHERRQAIEEVGGVRQHRHQMDESRRRRQRAQEHLERARLLRDELAPRLRSLERSARKARRLVELQRELDEAQQRYFSEAAIELEHELLNRHGAAKSAEAARNDAERRRDQATNQFAAVERDTALARKAVDDTSRKLSAARSQLRTLEHQQELDQQQRSWLSREVSDLTARLSRDRSVAPSQDLQTVHDALAQANDALASARSQRDSYERDRAGSTARHQRALADISFIRSDAGMLVRRWKSASTALLLSDDERARAEQVAHHAQAEVRALEAVLELRQREHALAREAIEEGRRRRSSLERQIELLDSQIEAMEQRQPSERTLRRIIQESVQDAERADALFGELMDATLHDSLEEAIDAAQSAVDADSGRVSAVVESHARGLIESLVAGVDFVEDVDEAKRSAAQGRTAVTRNGIVVRPDRVIQAGSLQPGARRMRRQLEDLRAERSELVNRLQVLPDERIAQLALRDPERSLNQASQDLDTARKVVSSARNLLEDARQRNAAARSETRALRDEAGRLRSRLKLAQRQRRQASDALSLMVETPNLDISELEQERDRCAAELAEVRAQLGSYERTRADRARLSSLRRELASVESAIRTREPELERAASSVADSEALDAANEHLNKLNDQRQCAAAEQERLQQARLVAERRAVEASAALRESESAHARLTAEAAAEGIDLKSLQRASQSTFELNGSGSHHAHGTNGSGNGASRAPQRSQTAVAVAARSVAELRSAVVDVRAKLQRLGPVDPGAAHEFEAEQSRWQGIESQITDLEATEASLREAERDLEQVIERKFREACRQVDEAFQRYFQLMFRGGKAQLVLTEEPMIADDDESNEPRTRLGVDIKAQPPGKRVSALGLLSGGERALTAIALLFALLDVRPAPFCILDEVDAALDEANVERFVTALRERASKTQFVIITHNRRTIEQADSIYGVTMGAAGVSRLLSVRVDELPGADA